MKVSYIWDSCGLFLWRKHNTKGVPFCLYQYVLNHVVMFSFFVFQKTGESGDDNETSITGTLQFSKKDYNLRLGSPSGSSVYGYLCSLWIPDIIRNPNVIVDYDETTKMVAYSGDFISDGNRYSVKLKFDPLNEGVFLSADIDVIYTPEKLGDWFSREGVVPSDYPELREVTHIEQLQFYQLPNGSWAPKKIYNILTPAPMFVISNERNPKDLKSKISRDANGKPILTEAQKRITRINVLNIDFSPDFKDSKKLSWIETPPNGTSIFIKEAPQIEYIWLDGKVVPKTDERMLTIARQDREFIPGPKESRFWLMAIGILVILIAGGIHLRRYLKSEDKF